MDKTDKTMADILAALTGSGKTEGETEGTAQGRTTAPDTSDTEPEIPGERPTFKKNPSPRCPTIEEARDANLREVTKAG